MSFSRMTAYLELLPTLYGIPMCELSVYHGHQQVYRHAVGDRPAGDRTMYRLFSMTKLFTCTAAMQLMEQGKLDLDDPVGKYLPTYAHMQVMKGGVLTPAENTMTIRHLMSMRSGLNYDTASPELLEARKNPLATTRELMLALGKDPLHFEPGTEFYYSLSHDVLGAVLEVITGKTLGELLKEQLFEPLEIADITFKPTQEQRSRIAPIYTYLCNTYSVTPLNDVGAPLSQNYESGGGGLYGTNDQYMKLVEALANNGIGRSGCRILKPESIAQMKVNHMHEGDILRFSPGKPGYGYGLGVRTLIDPQTAEGPGPVGEFGWDGAASSYNLVDTENRLAVVFTTHVKNCRPAFREIHPHIRNLAYLGIGIV